MTLATMNTLPVRSSPFDPIIRSEAMLRVMQLVERVSKSSVAVLIAGETGSGKEVVARAIHRTSLRCNHPWVDLNCAALPEHLVESELFGYEKGAFSGADTAKQGMFELADQGTLFLDEIGELDGKVQVKLLRVLDGVPYFRLGGSKKVSVDVRIIAATNQSLEEEKRTGGFRNDLYHRLSQFRIHVPPLRERPEDIEALADHFLTLQSPELHFAPEVRNALLGYAWPGNVRELRNVVMQAAMLVTGDTMRLCDLPEVFVRGTRTPVQSTTVITPELSTEKELDLDVLEQQAILNSLAKAGGHQGRAAAQLGISRRTLSRKLRQYRVQSESFVEHVIQPSMPQQFFRAVLDVPVEVTNDLGSNIQLRSANVSYGGIAVQGTRAQFKFTGDLGIKFTLPDGTEINAVGQMAWADIDGKSGVRFISMPDTARALLVSWINLQQKAQDWSATEQQSSTSPSDRL